MAKCLVQRGHRVIVVAPGAVLEMAEIFKRAGTELILLPEVGKINKLPSLSGWKSVAKIAADTQVDAIHSMDSINLARGYRASINTGKDFVCTEPGANWDFHNPPRKAKAVIFSHEQMDMYRELYKLAERNVRIIRARIDADLYHPEPPPRAFIAKYRLTQKHLTAGMVCRLEPNKAHQIKVLLDFIKSYRNQDKPVNIYVAGDGKLRASFQEQAKDIRNPSANLTFIGPVHDIQEVNWFYNFCDVVMGSGRGIMEAMACDKPVIILGEDGQAELIGPETIEDTAYYNFSGRHFRTKHNATFLRQALLEVLENPEKRKMTSEFGFDYIKSHLSAHLGAEQLINWYCAESDQSSMFDFWLWYLEASYQKVRASMKYRAKLMWELLK